jgi:colicin import membrane protein
MLPDKAEIRVVVEAPPAMPEAERRAVRRARAEAGRRVEAPVQAEAERRVEAQAQAETARRAEAPKQVEAPERGWAERREAQWQVAPDEAARAELQARAVRRTALALAVAAARRV